MLHTLNLKFYKTLYSVVVVFLETFQIFLELIYGKPSKSYIVLVIVYMIYTEYLEHSRTCTIEPFAKIFTFRRKAQL